jgi:hypothetical protein
MTDSFDLTGDEIVAKSANYFRNARFIVVLMMLGFGGYCLYDGFAKYPQQNEKQKENALAKARSSLDRTLTESEEREIIKDCEKNPKNSTMSISLNRAMGFLLPPGGFALLAWTLYRSRGVIRLKGETLEVPGHPAIGLDAIRRIDQTLWDRKGIAYIEYELADGNKGRACLDDFIHNDLAVKEIMTRIETFVKKKIEPDASEPKQV